MTATGSMLNPRNRASARGEARVCERYVAMQIGPRDAKRDERYAMRYVASDAAEFVHRRNAAGRKRARRGAAKGNN